MALTLAIGFLVDDAIVENVVRRRARRIDPKGDFNSAGEILILRMTFRLPRFHSAGFHPPRPHLPRVFCHNHRGIPPLALCR